MNKTTRVNHIINKNKSVDSVVNNRRIKLFKSKFNYPKLLNSWYFKFFNIGILIEKFNQKPVLTKVKMCNEIKVLSIFTLLITLLKDIA